MPGLQIVWPCQMADRMEQDKKQRETGMIEQFAGLRGKHVLEIGCGDGRVSRILAEKAGRYTAIDPDSRAIAKARSNIPNIDFRTGSGEDLEFENACFDVALFTLSLHHQNSALALSEVHRVLKPDGRLVVVEPAIGGEVQLFFDIFRDENDALAKSLKAIKECDFNVVREETFVTDWIFENKEELFSYCLDYHNTPANREIAAKMANRLGAKRNDQPLRLKETLNIFLLQKWNRNRSAKG